MVKQRSEEEIKVLFAKIKDGKGEWRPTKVEKIIKLCEQKTKEKNREGGDGFGFEEFYLSNEPTQILRCKHPNCVDLKEMDLRKKECWYYVQPLVRHLDKCRAEKKPLMKINDRLKNKSFYTKDQKEKIQREQALVCAEDNVPEQFWESKNLVPLFEAILEPFRVSLIGTGSGLNRTGSVFDLTGSLITGLIRF
jgi:hypothetical protein